MQAKSVAVVVAICFFFFLSCFFVVHQSQRGLVIRLGDITKVSDGKDRVYAPGLHWKLPIIDRVKTFDYRLRSFDVQSSRILTKEQKYVLVDYFVKWRVGDLAIFYQRTDGFTSTTERLLRQKVNDSLRAAFGLREISEVISGQRMDIMKLLRKSTNQSAKELGIKVVDVRIKRIDLPKEVSQSVFERMSAEREQVASKHRASGKAVSEKLRASADAKAVVILATARAEAADVVAKGIKKSAAMYNRAYQKDLPFYKMYRSLEAYKNTFKGHNDILLLQPSDNEYFKYFSHIDSR
jgi:modulator of FtsH protease HflC